MSAILVKNATEQLKELVPSHHSHTAVGASGALNCQFTLLQALTYGTLRSWHAPEHSHAQPDTRPLCFLDLRRPLSDQRFLNRWSDKTLSAYTARWIAFQASVSLFDPTLGFTPISTTATVRPSGSQHWRLWGAGGVKPPTQRDDKLHSSRSPSRQLKLIRELT